MFCPRCGATQNDELKFCKLCGANLHAVRQVITTRDADEKFDWSKTWVADMFLSGAEAIKRKQEIERLLGKTPEVKRYNEIKGGVITASIGLGLMVFLYIFMQGIVLSGNVPPAESQIISRIWIAGLIPFMIGIALIINGLFVSKKLVEIAKQEEQTGGPNALEKGAADRSLNPADTVEFIPSEFSVTEGTTKHLKSPRPKS